MALLLVLILVAINGASGFAQDVGDVEEFAVSGRNADGSLYAGRASLSRRGESCVFTWRIESHPPTTVTGHCLIHGDLITAGYLATNRTNQTLSCYALYVRRQDRSLDGPWECDRHAGRYGFETLRPR